MTSEKKRQSRAAFKEANEIAEGATAYLAAEAATYKEEAILAGAVKARAAGADVEVPYRSKAEKVEDSISRLASLIEHGEALMDKLGIAYSQDTIKENAEVQPLATVYSVMETAADNITSVETEVHGIFERIRDHLT